MQINPGLSFTRLSAAHIQIGSGYRALELTGVSRPINAYLEQLRSGIADDSEYQVARACGVSETDFELLHRKLAPLVISTPETQHFVAATTPEHRGSLARLRCVTPLLERGKISGLAAHTEAQFTSQRHSAALQIFGLGRTGTALAKILLNSGVGNISVWDSARVTSDDLGTGLSATGLGQIRSLVAAQSLNPTDQKAKIQPIGWLKQPALSTLATVHITLGGLDVSTIQEAKTSQHPYLPVVIRDDEIDIGPWVVDQAHACPLCLEAAASQTDRLRAQRVAALVENTGGIETVAGAHLVAGLLATDLLAMVDSQRLRQRVPLTKHGAVPGMSLDTFTRVHLANGWVQTFHVEPRPGCCAAVQELKIANTASP